MRINEQPPRTKRLIQISPPWTNLGELGIRIGRLYIGFYSRRQWSTFPIGVFINTGRHRVWITPSTIHRAITRH
jgi:hypothetical protein